MPKQPATATPRTAGAATREAGAFDRAADCFQRSLHVAASIGDRARAGRRRRLLGTVLFERGEFDRERGDRETTRERLDAAFEQFHEIDAPRPAIEVLEHRIALERDADDHETAREYCERAPSLIADTEFDLGDLPDRIDEHASRLDDATA